MFTFMGISCPVCSLCELFRFVYLNKVLFIAEHFITYDNVVIWYNFTVFVLNYSEIVFCLNWWYVSRMNDNEHVLVGIILLKCTKYFPTPKPRFLKNNVKAKCSLWKLIWWVHHKWTCLNINCSDFTQVINTFSGIHLWFRITWYWQQWMQTHVLSAHTSTSL